MSDIEFESNDALKEFNKCFKETFPDDCHPRQKADLMALFFAGYLSAIKHTENASDSFKSGDKAVFYMGEIKKDTFKRVNFLIECMVNNDYSHEMFNEK